MAVRQGLLCNVKTKQADPNSVSYIYPGHNAFVVSSVEAVEHDLTMSLFSVDPSHNSRC